jgi:outer membrane protein
MKSMRLLLLGVLLALPAVVHAQTPEAPSLANPEGLTPEQDRLTDHVHSGRDELLPRVQPAPGQRVLTLEQALTAARENHPTLWQAQANIELAWAQADAARAPLLPQLNGTASYQRTTSNFVFRPGNNPNTSKVVGGGGTTGIMGTGPMCATGFYDTSTGSCVAQVATNRSTALSNKTFDFFNLGLNATQLLYDFGYSIYTYRAAKTNASAMEINQRTTLLSVEYNVRNAFFNARANKFGMAVAQETLRNSERRMAQIQAFVEAGTRPEIDLAQLRTDMANARVALIQAENAYDIARATLNQAMGVEGPIDFDVADETLSAVGDEDASAEALLASAAQGRPELASLVEQMKAQRYRERAAKGQYGPAINATGAFTDAGLKLTELRWNWNVGVNFSWQLYNGGLTQANIRQARANLANLEAQVALIRQQVLLQLEQGRLAVRAARAVLDASGEALQNARLQLAYAEGRYQAGVGDVIELENAQLAVTNAAYQRVTAEYNLAIARAQLVNALGRRN